MTHLLDGRVLKNAAKVRALTLLILAAAATVSAQSNPEDQPVVVRPREIHDVLVNPGMGITTFQRFNGDALNPALGWSEEGPTARIEQAATPPDFPDTSIAYC